MSDQPETSRIIERRDESGQVESTTSDADENPGIYFASKTIL